jgi:hypothetical protein
MKSLREGFNRLNTDDMIFPSDCQQISAATDKSDRRRRSSLGKSRARHENWLAAKSIIYAYGKDGVEGLEYEVLPKRPSISCL